MFRFFSKTMIRICQGSKKRFIPTATVATFSAYHYVTTEEQDIFDLLTEKKPLSRESLANVLLPHRWSENQRLKLLFDNLSLKDQTQCWMDLENEYRQWCRSARIFKKMWCVNQNGWKVSPLIGIGVFVVHDVPYQSSHVCFRQDGQLSNSNHFIEVWFAFQYLKQVEDAHRIETK